MGIHFRLVEKHLQDYLTARLKKVADAWLKRYFHFFEYHCLTGERDEMRSN